MLKLFESWGKALPAVESEQPPAKFYQFCLYYTRGFKMPLFIMGVLTAILAVLEISLLGYLGDIVDHLAANKPSTLLKNEGAQLLWMTILIAVVIPILVLLQALVLYQSLMSNYPMSIRWLSHRYLLKQGVSFFQNDFAGRLAAKVMQTSMAVKDIVTKMLDVMIYIVTSFISMLVMVASADLRLLYPLLVWLVFYILILVVFFPRLTRFSAFQADATSNMLGRMVDSYANITTVKLFSHTDQEVGYAKEGMQSLLSAEYKVMRLVTGVNVSIKILNYMLIFAITAIAIDLWMDEMITIGAIAVAISITLKLNTLSQWVIWELSQLFQNIGVVIDGMQTFSQPTKVKDAPDSKPLGINKGSIVFDKINFNYDGQKPILDHLSMTIRAGEKVGIVGRTGAGKSTLFKILMRFHDVNSGTISIDGQNVKDVSQESLRAGIGLVQQEPALLHRTVKENILYGDPNATEAQLRHAIKQAEAEFVYDLEDCYGNKGLDAQVGEHGVKLSGGQRQRLCIARVLLKDAPILLLDEATSALDSEVEAAIQDSLYQLMQGKTVMAIAHRLSTIAGMDRLIVIDKGKIIEEGTHQALLDKNGVYAQLWMHQTGGFLGDI